jgi:Protein of unknown function (DUF4232)
MLTGNRFARMWRTGLVLASGLAALVTGAATAQTVSPPIQLPRMACGSSQLTASYVDGQGAAGTLEATLQLVNTSGSACALDGYVTVQLLDGDSAALPTNDVAGGGVAANFAGPSTFVLPRGVCWDTSLTSAADAIVMAEFNRHDVGAETIAAMSKPPTSASSG